MLVNMPLAEEQTIDLRLRTDVPIGDPYTFHFSSVGNPRSRAVAGVGRRCASGELNSPCKRSKSLKDLPSPFYPVYVGQTHQMI